MARARNIKPGFFQNEYLVELAYEFRLLFIGLWTLADRDGKLEDRPKKIKMELFPADDVNIEQGLSGLESLGFLERYEVNGKMIIQITNFLKHQRPHHTEKASDLPNKNGSITKVSSLNNGEPCVKDEEQDGENPPDSLIPDSLIPDSLNDDSLIPESSNGETPLPLQEAKADTCPHQQIIDLYHEILPAGRRVRCWTDKRKKVLRARWREEKKRQDLGWWRRFFEYIATCDFLMGKVHSQNKNPFEVSLDWIVHQENMIKIIEGAYQNREVSV